MIISLGEMRDDLRVTSDAEDAQILSYMQAAQSMIEGWIGRPVYRSIEDLPLVGAPGYDPYQIVADGAIVVALKKLVNSMYDEERGASGTTSEDAVPPASVRVLLARHRVFYRLPVVTISGVL